MRNLLRMAGESRLLRTVLVGDGKRLDVCLCSFGAYQFGIICAAENQISPRFRDARH